MSKVPSTGLYKQAAQYAALTKQLIIVGNITRAKKCMDLAGKLFQNGNAEMKNAVINVYMYSIISFLERQHCNVRQLVTGVLQEEYLKQLKAVNK